ncbi:MAG: TolC family protein [Deltaproteobacteria bacterium]|nr:TolC family protein [Deltaproteobacteria bacterium]MBI4794710.1 TolC family protein [Deltaproteobacteria bacterium]
MTPNGLALKAALCLALLMSTPAMAGPRAYSLPELEEITLKVHPGLRKAREEVRKNEAELRIAKQYPNPEVEFEGGNQRERFGTESGLTYAAALSQTVEWPGRRAKKQEAARFGIDSARKLVSNEELTVIARLRELFYVVLADEQFVKVARENLDSAKQLLDLVEKRVRLGESRQIELIKAQVEFYTLEREYEKARTTLAGDRQVLNRFLLENLPADFALSSKFTSLDEAIPLTRWREAALAVHPLLAAQNAALRQAESTLSAERQAWVPEVKLKFFHTLEIDQRTTGGGISLPLPLWNRKGGEVDKAAAARRQAAAELGLTRQELETKLAAQHSLYMVARRQVESFQKNILPQAAESLRLAEFTYRQGETGLLELLDSRRVYRTTESDYYQALLDYWQARTELWRIAGGGV